MTWYALFTSWQFWLVLVVNTFTSVPFGMGIAALLKANGPDPESLQPGDLSLELLSAKSECQRLQEENEALRMQNADLLREQDEHVHEVRHGSNEAV